MDTDKWRALELDGLRSISDMLNLKGKTALITGGSGGIGRSAAAALAELGADVAITGTERSREKMKGYCEFIAGKYGTGAVSYVCDVSREEEVDALYRDVCRDLSAPDVVFSNAGYFSREDHAGQSAKAFQKMLDVDVVGMFLVCRRGAALMKERGKGGSLILNASMTGHIVNRMQEDEHYYVAYPAAKAAIIHMTKALALEYAKDKIRVNSISPGYILSGIHDGRSVDYFRWSADHIPMKRYGTLDEIVGSVVYLASGLSTYTTGADILVDGGYCAW